MLIPQQLIPIHKLAPKDGGKNLPHVVHLSRSETTGRARLEVACTAWVVRAEFTDLASGEYPALAAKVNLERNPALDVMVPVTNWVEAGKQLPKKTNLPVLECLAVEEHVSDTNGRKRLQMVTTDLDTERVLNVTLAGGGGSFANIDQVMPKTRIVGEHDPLETEVEIAALRHEVAAVEISVNPYFLAELLNVIGDMQDIPGCPMVSLRIPLDGTRPMEIVAQAKKYQIEMRAVLAPVNGLARKTSREEKGAKAFKAEQELASLTKEKDYEPTAA